MLQPVHQDTIYEFHRLKIFCLSSQARYLKHQLNISKIVLGAIASRQMTEKNSTFFRDFYSVEIILKKILLPWNTAWDLLSNPENHQSEDENSFVNFMKKIKVVHSYNYDLVLDQLIALKNKIQLYPEVQISWKKFCERRTLDYSDISQETQKSLNMINLYSNLNIHLHELVTEGTLIHQVISFGEKDNLFL